jgi:hypothetical protein
MAPVSVILKERLPGFRDICDLLEQHLYNPIQNGQPVNIYAATKARWEQLVAARINASILQTQDNSGEEMMDA